MDEAKIDASRYFIIPIRDLRVHDLWVANVVSQTPRFEVVFSNEPVTSRLFKEAGFRVEPIPFYDLKITLDGDDYILNFKFNSREERWYFDIYDKEDNPLLLGNKILCLYPLLNLQTDARDLPPGFFYCASGPNDNSPPGLYDLGEDRRCQLIYYDEASLV